MTNTLEFKNSNGNTYLILLQSGETTLLAKIKSTEFIVAKYLEEDSWGYGMYFGDDLQAALTHYKKETGKGK